tara:strand:- start:3387 stop:3539 length:153 start_codon:yes stop_codon:yes gene_type:complete
MKKDKLKKIKDRIKYLEMEISHERFWDGYALKGMKDELKKLNKKLKSVEE